MKDGKLTLPLESEKDNNSISDNEYSVFDADGYWLCDVRDEDHAKTVVRAVNSHDALVEALQNCLAAMEAWGFKQQAKDTLAAGRAARRRGYLGALGGGLAGAGYMYGNYGGKKD